MQRNFTASQLFSRLLTSCHLFSTTLISAHLVKALLNSLFISLPSSQLFSARAFPFARSLWPVQFAFILLPGNYNIGATIHNSLTSSSIVLLFNSTGSLLPIASSMLHPNRIPNRFSFQHLHPFLHSPSIMHFHSNLVDCGTNVQPRCSRSILSRAVTSRGALMAPVRCTPFACRSRRQHSRARQSRSVRAPSCQFCIPACAACLEIAHLRACSERIGRCAALPGAAATTRDLCFATRSLQIAVEWLRQVSSKATCS